MLRNYLLIAWRNLLKNRIYSGLNIVGLAIGLSCFLLIALYVTNELSYDRFFNNADRIYRINSDIRFGGSDLHLPVTSDMMGEVLQKDYPQVEAYTRLFNSSGGKLLRKGNEFIEEGDVVHADSTLFRVFSLKLLEGEAATALNDPNTVVLTEAAAIKYFGTPHALGKTLRTQDDEVYQVTGVLQNLPGNTHLPFHFFFSMDNVDYGWGNYLSHNFHTYLLLKEGTDVRQFEKQLAGYTDRYVLPQTQQMMQIQSMAEFEKAGNKLQYSLVPLSDIHLKSDRSFKFAPGGNIQYVYIFSAVALFILLIACVNFMNLATARSAGRAKEVGIRKVLGTGRKQLVAQFLTEATLMTFVALLLALGIAALVLPLFNNLAAKQLALGDLFDGPVGVMLVVLPFAVGLLAGSYPAFFLSGFQPIQVLKGRFSLGAKGGTFRSVLVVFQFTTSIILIIGTIIIYRQLSYIQHKNLGFSKDQVLVVNNTSALGNGAKVFKEALLQLPGVQSGTLSGYLPVSASARNDQSFFKEATVDAKSGFNMQMWRVDEDYIPTLGMTLARGRNFSRSFATDSSGIILNEAAAKLLGYADPVGKKVYTVDDIMTGKQLAFNIIGVVKDFHFESLRKEIGPLSMVLSENNFLSSFRISAAQIPQVLDAAKTRWKQLSPAIPFSYRFLDESFDEMYRQEQRVGQIALLFSVLAIVVACLGLFGLATFIAEKRTKEIGIRKVLGASVNGLVQLLSKDSVRLVLLSLLIACPIAWYAMHRWLQDFAFRIDIGWWVFVLAGVLALVIAIATVSIQAFRAALASPVKNLRTE